MTSEEDTGGKRFEYVGFFEVVGDTVIEFQIFHLLQLNIVLITLLQLATGLPRNDQIANSLIKKP